MDYIQIAQDQQIRKNLLHGVNLAAVLVLELPTNPTPEQEALHRAAVKIIPYCDIDKAATNEWVGRAASIFAAWCEHKGHLPKDVTPELAQDYGKNNLLAFSTFL